jgi:hypothetical protein
MPLLQANVQQLSREPRWRSAVAGLVSLGGNLSVRISQAARSEAA